MVLTQGLYGCCNCSATAIVRFEYPGSFFASPMRVAGLKEYVLCGVKPESSANMTLPVSTPDVSKGLHPFQIVWIFCMH